MKRLLLIGGVVLLAAAIGFGVGYREMQRPPDSIELAAQAIYSTTLNDLDGKAQSLAQWKGKVLVVNFWATWCPPCREEIPGFIKFQEKYRLNGVQFVGIAIDDRDKVRAFATEVGINYPSLLGDFSAIELSRTSGNHLGGLPFTAILDRNGALVATKVGELSADKLEAAIKPLL